MSLSDFLFGKNPADKAMPYLEQIAPTAQAQLDPYIQRGEEASGQLMDIFGGLASMPAEYLDELMGQYKPSESFQFKADLLNRAMGNTAAAGGYAGNEYDQLMRAQNLSGLMNEDIYNWLDRVLGLGQEGRQGLQNFSNQGFQAGGEMADISTQALSSQAGAQFQGQQQRNQNRSDLYKALGQAIGGTMGFGGQDTASLFGKKLW